MISRRKDRPRKGSPGKSAIGWPERGDSIDDIARRLDELLQSMGDDSQPSRASLGPGDPAIEAARRVCRVRQERDRLFGPILAEDPAWYILLHLFIAKGEGREVSVASAGAATGLAEPIVLRCIAHLAEAKLVAREPRPFDDDVMYLTLTERGLSMMSEYLDRVITESGVADA